MITSILATVAGDGMQAAARLEQYLAGPPQALDVMARAFDDTLKFEADTVALRQQVTSGFAAAVVDAREAAAALRYLGTALDDSRVVQVRLPQGIRASAESRLMRAAGPRPGAAGYPVAVAREAFLGVADALDGRTHTGVTDTITSIHRNAMGNLGSSNKRGGAIDPSGHRAMVAERLSDVRAVLDMLSDARRVAEAG